MRYSEAGLGRVFVVRLEDGDSLPEAIEDFAREKGVRHAACLLVGGVRGGSRLVVGPESEEAMPPVPVTLALAGVHEAAGVGTIFPDERAFPAFISTPPAAGEGRRRPAASAPASTSGRSGRSSSLS